QVAQRPLWIPGRLVRSASAEDDRTERITASQRAVAATTHVTDAAPVDAFVSLRRGDQDVTGVRRGEGRPEPRQCIRILLGLETPAGHVAGERLRLTTHRPAGAAAVAELPSGPEAELMAIP